MNQKDPNINTRLEDIEDVIQTYRETDDNNREEHYQFNNQPDQNNQSQNQYVDQQLPQPKVMRLLSNKKTQKSRRYTYSQQNQHQLAKAHSVNRKNSKSFKRSKLKKSRLYESLDRQLSPLKKQDTEKQKLQIRKIQEKRNQLLKRITQLNKEVIYLTKNKQKQPLKANKQPQANSFLPAINKLKLKLNENELSVKNDTDDSHESRIKSRIKVKTQQEKDNQLRQVVIRNKKKMKVLDGKQREFKQVHKLHHVCLECSPAHKNLQVLNKDLINLN